MATDQGMLGQWYDDYMKAAPKTTPYTPVQATPTEWKPDDSQTVQGQVAQITKQGGPLQTLAETKSKQEMNARGMLNSSMAIGAGQKALYEAALPIAQQDANTNAQRGQFNAGQANQVSQFNAGAQNESGQFNASEANKGEAARFDAAAKFGLQDKDNASKVQLQDKAQSDALARMAQQFKDNQGMLELQTKLADQSFPKQFAASFTTNLMNQVNGFLGDPNLSSAKGPNGEPSPKENAVQNAITFANTSLSWMGTMYKVAFPSLTAPGAAAPAPAPMTFQPGPAMYPLAPGTTEPYQPAAQPAYDQP